MAAASSAVVAVEGARSCLCGTVQSSSAILPRVRSGALKCRICRTKPRFFLRSQRSLDLGASASVTASTSAATTPTSHTGSPARVEQPRRRARSAERYDGMRINGDQAQPSLELYFVRAPVRSLQSPAQSHPSPSLASSRLEEVDANRQTMSPPPDYSPLSMPAVNGSALPASMMAAPASPPPTYEEAELSKKAMSPPSYEESMARSWTATTERTPRQSSSSSLQLTASSFQASPQQHGCSCSKCQAFSSTLARSSRMALMSGTELRGSAPMGSTSSALSSTTDDETYVPTATQYLRSPGAGALSASSHDQCSCYKCQSRYSSSYGDHLGDNEVLLTLETQTAMQGVLTDGVALCSLV